MRERGELLMYQSHHCFIRPIKLKRKNAQSVGPNRHIKRRFAVLMRSEKCLSILNISFIYLIAWETTRPGGQCNHFQIPIFTWLNTCKLKCKIEFTKVTHLKAIHIFDECDTVFNKSWMYMLNSIFESFKNI